MKEYWIIERDSYSSGSGRKAPDCYGLGRAIGSVLAKIWPIALAIIIFGPILF